MEEVKGKIGTSVKGHMDQARAVEMEGREVMGQKFIFNLRKNRAIWLSPREWDQWKGPWHLKEKAAPWGL